MNLMDLDGSRGLCIRCGSTTMLAEPVQHHKRSYTFSALKICFYYVLRIIWTHSDMSSRDYFDEAEMKVMMTTEPKHYSTISTPS